MWGSQHGGMCAAFPFIVIGVSREWLLFRLGSRHPGCDRGGGRDHRGSRQNAVHVGAVQYVVAVASAVVCLWLIGAIKLPDPGVRRRLGWNERFSGARIVRIRRAHDAGGLRRDPGIRERNRRGDTCMSSGGMLYGTSYVGYRCYEGPAEGDFSQKAAYRALIASAYLSSLPGAI